MRRFLGLPPAAIVIGGILVIASARPGVAKPDWTKKERKQCVYCHVGSWESGKYTGAGQYYKDHEFSFKGYVPKSGTDSGKAADRKPTSSEKH